MYLLLIASILFNILFIALFSRFIGKNGIIFVTVLNFFISWLSSILIFYEVVYCGYTCTLKLFSWMDYGLLKVDWGLLFDPVSSVMSFIVVTIAFCVHLYTLDYMKDDANFIKFYIYLNIFTFFMLLFVTADNFLQMFLGWEGIGITSYLLINFWSSRTDANSAAIKALIINRVGDLFIYFAIILIFSIFGSLTYYSVFAMAYSVSNDYFLFFEILKVKKISVLMFFLFVGTMSKSAQIGLHGWLPEAMEGPTPVSALLHAATMVTAGVYLFIRCAPLLEYCKNLLFLVFFVGCVTALYTSLVGMYQTDIKKIIAYSTCSQLGYMICICGLSGFSIALFHLFNHAFFKALLFLCAGAIIHANSGEQDIRKMGGLLKIMPVTYSSMLIGSLSLAGFPFFSGYYSKDLIIESVYCSKLPHSLFVYCLLVLVALFTSLYSFRVIYLVFLSQYNGFKVNLKGLREPSLIVIVVYIFLSLFSIFSGYLFRDLFVGLGVNSWSNCFPTSLNNAIVDIEFLNFYIKLIPTVFSFLGFSTSFLFFYFSSTYFNFNKKFFINKNFTIFFCDKCYFDYIYSNIIIYCWFYFSHNIFNKLVDKGFTEFFGPIGIIRLLNRVIIESKKTLNGLIYNYSFYILISVLYFISIIDFFVDFLLIGSFYKIHGVLFSDILLPLVVIIIFIVIFYKELKALNLYYRNMLKLVDRLGLDSNGETRMGSNPIIPIMFFFKFNLNIIQRVISLIKNGIANLIIFYSEIKREIKLRLQ